MMNFVKRHGFLLGLAGAFLIVVILVGLIVQFQYRRPAGRIRKQLDSAARQAKDLGSRPLYTEQVVADMAKEVAVRKERYQEVLDAIREMGIRREPLVEGLFPVSTDANLRHSFKAAYDDVLRGFAEHLGAVNPMVPADASDAEKENKIGQIEKAAMYTDPKRSFSRPDWVDKPEAPSLAMCRQAQEDIWLMEDLVRIIADLNEEFLGEKPAIRNAPVKELVEIRIGGSYAVLEGSGMSAASGRYRMATSTRRPGESPRALTLTGRVSEPGFYRALPFSLVVVVESRLCGELIRRLKGTESFFTVEAWRLEPIIEITFERSGGLLATEREEYGSAGVVLLRVVGESLIFELQGGGRVTTPKSEAVASAAALGKD
ncbi:MAG: hypothetical protein WBC59_03535 [Phycisphaerae bacterium]